MAKKYSIYVENDKIISLEVDGVKYKHVSQIPDPEERAWMELLVEGSPALDLGGAGGSSVDLAKIILPLFLGITLLMLAIAAIAGVYNLRALSREKHVLGRVVDLEVRLDEYGNQYYHPVVEFSLPDNSRTRFTTAEGSWPPAYEKGALVTVRYDPGPPLSARISSLSGNLGMWTVSIITGVLALAFAGATVFAWWLLKDETAKKPI
jgi:hypothetical protein